MLDIYVRDVIRLGDGRLIKGDCNLIIENFCTDDRKVQEGDVYVAIRGEKFNGNLIYRTAIEKEASCCILDRNIKDGDDLLDCTIVVVKDTLDCLQRLASYKRDLYDIPVIGITGSTGKTSTKDLIYSVVSKKT